MGFSRQEYLECVAISFSRVSSPLRDLICVSYIGRWVLYSQATREVCTQTISVWVGAQSHLFVTPWTVAHEPPLSMGFSRQEYWSGLSCPPPGDLTDPETKPESPASPALQANSFPLSHRGSPSSGHSSGQIF